MGILCATVGATYTAPTPAFAVAAAGGATSVNEGSTLNFNVTGTNIPDGTYYWSSSNTTDFVTTGGSFGITSNSGTFSVTPTADLTTEGAETFTVSVRLVSTSGTIVATSATITINDTSLTPAPTYAVAAAGGITSVNEGTAITFNVTTTNVPNGTTLYFRTNRDADFNIPFAGSFTINSNAGSFSVTPTADTTTEGAETFQAQVRTVDINGTIVATSANITINDTSTAPTLWSTTISTGTITSIDMSVFSANYQVAIHGVSNGHLVGVSIHSTASTGPKTITPWVYNVTTGAMALGTGVSTITGSTGNWARIAANGANGMTFSLAGGSYTLRGYQITNYASVSTTTLPTITMASATSVPYTGAGNGNTGNSLSVDRINGQYIPYARNSGDSSGYRRVSYTHPSTYTYAFSVNQITLNGVGQGRANNQTLTPIPGTSMNVTVVDDPNGSVTFANVMGSTSERGFNFYTPAGGWSGQGTLISYSGSGDAASATVIVTGAAGAAAGTYRSRRLAVTNQNTGAYLDALTTVTLTNGYQDWRTYAYKPNASNDYLVIYRNGNLMYGAKVSADGATKTEYGQIADTAGYTTWSATDSFLDGSTVYTASLIVSGTTGKIMVTKFTG